MTTRQIDPVTGCCICPTCSSVEAALDADLAARRRSHCAACDKPIPAAAPRRTDAAGDVFCVDCCCECCGAMPSTDCGCEITVIDGFSRETGPYEDRGCLTHRRSV